ncbi:MAG TPA: hypothetical protein VHF24_13450 [Acidimicrobiales bacterium]|jgi:hypothetical protein|nr:hypothetical protein [Acidimicrobiales bacterium]
MSNTNPTLETYEQGGSVTARKMRAAAEKIDVPKHDDRLLSPYRDDAAG